MEKKKSIKKELDSEPVYNKNYLKAKTKSYNGKMHTNKTSKKGSQFICLSVMLIDSVFKTGKNYYPQVFWEKFKYVAKKRSLSILMTI